jgi:hypothetical protein
VHHADDQGEMSRSSSWQPPRRLATAVACVGEDRHVDALLRAALANRRSLPPIEEFCRVRVVPEADEVAIYSKNGEQLASLSYADALELGPQIEQTIAQDGEMWCDARISGTESLSAQWRMQIWVYFEDYATTL